MKQIILNILNTQFQHFCDRHKNEDNTSRKQRNPLPSQLSLK